eukprot:CCRYP_014214-RB/>CCRYP_014214-RB protein AED:0.47 eAED:0.83 QI:0/0/0/1/0/0/2/0/181
MSSDVHRSHQRRWSSYIEEDVFPFLTIVNIFYPRWEDASNTPRSNRNHRCPPCLPRLVESELASILALAEVTASISSFVLLVDNDDEEEERSCRDIIPPLRIRLNTNAVSPTRAAVAKMVSRSTERRASSCSRWERAAAAASLVTGPRGSSSCCGWDGGGIVSGRLVGLRWCVKCGRCCWF